MVEPLRRFSGLFRRRRTPAADAAPAISEFWAAWPRLRDRIAADLAAGKAVAEESAAELERLARAIHPALVCEADGSGPAGRSELAGLDIGDFSESVLEDLARLESLSAEQQEAEAGQHEGAGRFALTLTGGADDAARVQAERWFRAAPAEDDWSFHPARRADPERLSGIWTWDGHEFDLGHAMVALRADQAALKIDATVYHPDNMFVSEAAREALARHVVTLAVGEDDAVRWIGAIGAAGEKPQDPLPPSSIPSVVEQLLSALGGVKWVKAQGRGPIIGAVQIGMRYPLHRRDFPAFTLYVQLTVPYAHSSSDRLPDKGSVEALQRFEATLQEVLGSDGALLAQRTMAGRRQYHLYLNPDAEILPAVEKAASDWPEGRAALSSFTDPEWEAIAQVARPLRRRLGH